MPGDESGKWFMSAELLIEKKFAHFGEDVMQVLQRVFRRYGNFKPLLRHLNLEAEGDLEAQQLVLQRVLSQFGKTLFLEAVDAGLSPAALALNRNQIAVTTETDPNLTPIPSVEAEAPPLPVATPVPLDFPARPERRRTRERRSKTPGRRQKLDLGFDDNRRKGCCRRKGPRRNGDS